MALQTPTVAQIDSNIINDIETSLGQTVPILPKAFIRVLSKVFAGVFILLYKYGGFIFQQMFVSTASDRETTINGAKVNPLLFWGRLIGVGDPTAATVAEFTVTVTVTNQTGTLPGGSQLVNSDNGVTYITLAPVNLNAPTVTATIRAISDEAGGHGAGVIGNLTIGVVVSFVAPLANINQDAVIASQTVTGADGETFAQYRVRVVDFFQKRPKGGALSDYEIWAEEVTGIVSAYPYTGGNPGEVDIYIEATVASSGSPDGVPTTAQLTAVKDNINKDQNGLATRRPVNAFVNTIAISRTSFDITVTGLVVSDPAITQADITAAATAFFLAREPFVDGLTIPPRLDTFTVHSLVSMINDIVIAANGTFSIVTFKKTSTPGNLNVYILGQGEKAKLGTVTFV